MAAPASEFAALAPSPEAVTQSAASLARALERLVEELGVDLATGAERFERIASQRLKARLPDFIAAWSTQAFLNLPRAPQQRAENNYGSPTITLYRDERFRVEVIFWGLGPEVYVHDHVEPGAFGVVRGPRIHSTYSFEPAYRPESDIEVGRLRSRRVEVLPPGSVVEIPPGDGLIHSLFYPHSVNITLSVRKTAENWSDAGLSRFYVAPSLRVAMGGDASADRFSDFLRREIEESRSSDPSAVLEAYCGGDRSRILRLLLADWVNASPATFQFLLEMAQTAFREQAPQLAVSLDHFRRSFLYRAIHNRLTIEQSVVAFLILADASPEDAVSAIAALSHHASVQCRRGALEELADLSLTLDGQKITILEPKHIASAMTWFAEWEA